MSRGRFANLEYGGEREPSRPGASGRVGEPERHFVDEVRDAAYHLAQAERRFLAGEPEAALRSFSAALGENPLCLEAWVGQVLMLLDLEEYAEARTWADKALESFPDSPPLLAVKAAALHRMGLRREARDLCDRAIGAKGESDLVWLCRGELMLADSRPAAEDCFGHALRLAGNKALMQVRIGERCLRHGSPRLALSSLQAASAGLPGSPLAWHLLGSAQESLGLFEQARTSYRQAAELAPHNTRYGEAVRMQSPSLGRQVLAFLRRVFGR